MWALAPSDLFTVGIAWAVTIPVMAANRTLLNMRLSYHDRPTTLDAVDEIGTEFQVARRPQESGEPRVWSTPSGSEI
ncbi:hypothetical protein FB45DRAFT_955398 [Roridomyces roridus]|uniref:Uncharacterized protein n=1 Tax=Roridomyces roridus TaxID=1738132 RepID=A0AAD7F6D1_9AGAR|nr:hypothetical protein FB45DRAFT_955398 [Roridomyces roridus]